MDIAPTHQPPRDAGTARLRKAAEELETAFLTEVLKAAGAGAPRQTLGGGAGEEQFAFLLRQTQAEAMMRQGGIGLAEQIFNCLREAGNAARSADAG